MNYFLTKIWIYSILVFSLCLFETATAGSLDYFIMDTHGRKGSNLYLVGNMFTYSDINASQDSNINSFIYAPSLGVSLGYRVHEIFSFSLNYRFNSTNQRKTAGVSFRAYLPGLWLIGDSVQNFLIDFPNRRFHSYLEGEIGSTSSADENGVTTRYYENAGRLGLEITLFRGVYLDGSFGLAFFRGNNVFLTGAGLGFRF